MKKSEAAISRDPPGPVATRVPPSASTAAGRSDAGSACASEPPRVPLCLTAGSPTWDATCASRGQAAVSSAECSRALWLVRAPMDTVSPSTLMPRRSSALPMSTSTLGLARRSLMSGISDWPPASNLASSPCSPSAATAASAESALTYPTAAGIMMHLPRRPRWLVGPSSVRPASPSRSHPVASAH